MLLLWWFFVCFLTAFCYCFDNGAYDDGQKQYEALVADSRHPKYGPCWTDVLEDVKQGCRRLTEDRQHRLALGFTNCFLAKTGRPTYSGCSGEIEDVSTCVRDMDSAAFGAYTNFFTHSQSLCYFLENVRWQENAELTIDRLIDQTLSFEERLRDWNHSVLSFENRTLNLQAQLIEAGSRLSTSLDQSQQAVAVMRQASADQHAIIRDVFRQLTSLQEMVVDEFAGFYAYAYYVASTGLAYVLTSTARTDAARVPLLTVTSSTFAVERFVLRQVLTFCLDLQGRELTATALHSAVWWLRRVAVFVCLTILAWSAITFRDLHVINHSLLEGVAREQRYLRKIYSRVASLRDAVRERSLTPRERHDDRHHRRHHHGYAASDDVDDTATAERVTPTARNGVSSNNGTNGFVISNGINNYNNNNDDAKRPARAKKRMPATSPTAADADDEGDGGNVSDDGSTMSALSISRYNLRSRPSMASTPLSNGSVTPRPRESTPTSASVRSRRSRSRSRSQMPGTLSINSSRVSESSESELFASVEAAARRTARSAKLARLTRQHDKSLL